MLHDERHKGLLACLVLGEISNGEANEVAALLETCAGCPADLVHFQKVLGPGSETTVRVHLGLLLSGFRADINQEIALLKGHLRSSWVLERIPLRAGASADAEDAVIVSVDKDDVQALVDVVQQFLAARQADEDRLRTTTLGVGVTVNPDADTPLNTATAIDERKVKNLYGLISIRDDGEE